MFRELHRKEAAIIKFREKLCEKENAIVAHFLTQHNICIVIIIENKNCDVTIVGRRRDRSEGQVGVTMQES